MFKKIFLLTCVFFVTPWLFIVRPVHAIFLELTTEQIEEAVEYGKKNKNIEIAAFSRPWTICKDKGQGTATLFTPFHNIAYKARKSAIEHREFTHDDVMHAVEIGDTLTFSVTVYGDEYDFCAQYTAKLYYKDDDSPSHSARLVFKFPTKGVDLSALITLVIVAPGGEENLYDFELAKMK